MNYKLSFLFLLIISAAAKGQDEATDYIEYSNDFRFRDGIFVTFEAVKSNNPIPKSLIVNEVNYDSPDFYNRILDERQFQYFDQLGSTHELQVRNIWGYADKGVLYINMNNDFFRINIIGNICHFVASVSRYRDYYDSYSPYRSPYDYPYSPYYSNYPPAQTTEMRQFLLDFTTGEVMEYDIQAVEILLMTDPELHDEFVALSKRKKNQQKFLYIRKFNERNPLYFPAR